MRYEKIENVVSATEETVGLPPGLLRAVVFTENGAPQSSRRAFAYASFDLFARRVEPAFYQRYIVGTPWETSQWGDTPEVIAASYGLTQVMFTTATWALEKKLLLDPRNHPDYPDRWHVWNGTPWDLFQPLINLRVGAEVLAYKAKRYGSWKAGVAAYNAGSARRMDDGLFVNQSYVDSVVSFLGHDLPAMGVDA